MSRGWNLTISGIIEVHHVEDSSRSSRPRLAQNAIDLILEIVTRNSTTRGCPCNRIAYEVSTKLNIPLISRATI